MVMVWKGVCEHRMGVCHMQVKAVLYNTHLAWWMASCSWGGEVTELSGSWDSKGDGTKLSGTLDGLSTKLDTVHQSGGVQN